MALYTSHHICCYFISLLVQTQRWPNSRESSRGANTMRAPCSNCGDQWLLPVRWACSLASAPVGQCRYSQTRFQWPPKHLTQTDTATLLDQQSHLPKSKSYSLFFFPPKYLFLSFWCLQALFPFAVFSNLKLKLSMLLSKPHILKLNAPSKK